MRHVGDPGFQTSVGDDMGIHQSTVSNIFATVVDAIFAKADTWIQFPIYPADFQAAKDNLQNISLHFHVQLVHLTAHTCKFSNQVSTEMNICRKGLATLNVQVLCDASKRFTSVSANWPGSVHDSRIWKNSDVGALMANAGTYVGL